MGIAEYKISTEQGLFERIVVVICCMAKAFRNAEVEKSETAVREKLYMLALKTVVALSKCLLDICHKKVANAANSSKFSSSHDTMANDGETGDNDVLLEEA